MNQRTRRTILIVLVSVLLVVTVLFMCLLLFDKDLEPILSHLRETEVQTEEVRETEAPAPETEAAQTESETESEQETEEPLKARTQSIYTLSQGPVAWESKTPYSGEWCEFEMEGGRFSVFGCGLCFS